ncbi:hypothetical protein NI17_001370 [Thermobifida halotolerans]|uniref:Uncharacterized protein n=1 Tax=Thermobifida halotolerans TaxID=483545 RepID=A0A399G5Y2_9ACTN|nr:hypothetical protein [Thermobifida halotolerans]UOE19940.1 hypothetical protein NI17_001370 [Thermobifida halotolerans]
MIIWRGWGILVVLMAAIPAVLGAVSVQALLGEAMAPLGAGIGLVVGGVASFLVGQRLNAPVQGYHPATGQPVLYKNRHTLFFIPMQYCGVLLLVLGAVLGVVGLSGV